MIYKCVNIAVNVCIKMNFLNFISINTEKISFKLIYPIKKSNLAKWNLIQN